MIQPGDEVMCAGCGSRQMAQDVGQVLICPRCFPFASPQRAIAEQLSEILHMLECIRRLLEGMSVTREGK